MAGQQKGRNFFYSAHHFNVGILLFYMTSSLSPTGHSLMIALFILNVVIAHVAAFIIYGLPLIRKHMSR